MPSDFARLVEDLRSARCRGEANAWQDHQGSGADEDSPSILVDLAPLLGLESATHLVLELGNLSAVAYFRVAESSQKLLTRKKVEGWPQPMCWDVALLSAMHQSPSVEGSGLSLLDLYELFVVRPSLRPLWLYLIERVGRAYPSLVRPEIALEIHFGNLRRAAMEAVIAAGGEAESVEPPTQEEINAAGDDLALLPQEERHPNGSAL